MHLLPPSVGDVGQETKEGGYDTGPEKLGVGLKALKVYTELSVSFPDKGH